MMNFIAFIFHRILIVRVIKSRTLRWAGHVSRIGEGRAVYRVLVGRPKGNRPLGKPKLRWDDKIKMGLRDVGIDGANWIRVAHDRVQWRAFVNSNEPSGSLKKAGCRLTSRMTISFSKNILDHEVSKGS
jgi:hypothetical protein